MRLIDADALCRHLDELKTGDRDTVYEYYDDGIDTAISTVAVFPTIAVLPAIEVEPVKHGRWIVVSDGYGNGDATAHICECSECKDTIWVYKKATRRWNYCPNCGAKMDAEEGEAHEQN